jgi:UDP-2,3-diacylglucosamine hydrolase
MSVPDASNTTIGLVAGWGRFPLLVAQSLVKRRYRVVCVALHGHADPALEYCCDHVQWMGVAKLGGHLRYFRNQSADAVTLAGKLFKADLLFRGRHWWRLLPDLECLRTLGPFVLRKKADTRDDQLLTAITDAYSRRGLTICSATDLAPELLAPHGMLGTHSPSAKQWQDIAFGWNIAKQMGQWDIGQTITVHRGSVLAVEAIEGTDQCIARTGQLCRPGWTLIKVAKPQQDMRFDVPTIGMQTLQQVHAAGGRAIAIEADKTIIVDREQVLAWADRYGIAVVALHDEAEARAAA